MCGTKNDERAHSCSYCGYIFEDFSSQTDTLSNSFATAAQNQPQVNTVDTKPPLAGSPLFVVSRSLLSSLSLAIVYLVVIVFFGLYSSVYFIIFVAFFLLLAVMPILLTPRKYEFFDTSLKIHKIVGGDTEISYSDLTLNESQAGRRRPQIVLSVEGERRMILIPGNPSNNELGLNLNEFLEKNVKKPKPVSEEKQEQKGQDASAADSVIGDSSYSANVETKSLANPKSSFAQESHTEPISTIKERFAEGSINKTQFENLVRERYDYLKNKSFSDLSDSELEERLRGLKD
jgi:hypothetical protein